MSTYSIGNLNRLGDAMEKAGWVADDVTKLRQSDLEQILRFLHGQAKIVPISILRHLGTVTVPARAKNFVAGKNFILKQNGGICSGFGSNFRSWFLEGDGKIEDASKEETLNFSILEKSLLDPLIIGELGGEERSETTLSQMFFLMEKQKGGEDGVLLNNGSANIFYIKDQKGVLRTVRVYWLGDGWDVDAGDVSYPYVWLLGYRVFSRKPLETLVRTQV